MLSPASSSLLTAMRSETGRSRHGETSPVGPHSPYRDDVESVRSSSDASQGRPPRRQSSHRPSTRQLSRRPEPRRLNSRGTTPLMLQTAVSRDSSRSSGHRETRSSTTFSDTSRWSETSVPAHASYIRDLKQELEEAKVEMENEREKARQAREKALVLQTEKDMAL